MGGKLTTLHDQNILKPKSALSVENIDLKKLRRLILTRRLAPFWDPSDLEQAGREECPICNYWYPSMNSASCCTARLCTECFVSCQTSSEPPGKATCPFCKHSPFCVRYSGSKSLQQIEEEGRQKQIVAEAKLRRLRSFDSSAAQRLQQQPAASTATADSSDHQQRQQFNPAAARRQGAGALQGSNRVSYGNTADEVTSTNEARILRHQQRHQRSDAVPAVMFAQQHAEQPQHPPLPTSTLLPQNLVEQDSQQRDVQPVIDQHMHQQQQRPEQQQQQQLPDEAEEQTEPTIPNLWFEAALLPLYVRNELAGLQLEELEQIMVEQALIASMQQAASSSAVEQTAHSQLGSSQFPAAATCQGSSQLTQTLGTAAAAAAAAAIHGALPVVQQRQQQHPAEHYDWQSCMTVYQLAAVVTAYSSSGGQEAVVPLYMVSGGSSSSEGSDACLQHRQRQQQQDGRKNVEQQAQTTQAGMLARDDREEQKQEGSQLTTDATPATAGQGAESTIGCHEEPVATAGDEFKADVQGYVLSAPALLSALEGCSAAAAAAGGGGGEEAFMHTFISLSNEQQQQAAAAAMATSLAVVQNPDGSVLLLTDIPGRITPAAAAAVAAAAVVPISELCNESDTGLQRHLAAADARFAVAAAARNSSRQDSPHSATVAADQTRAGAAAPSGVAVHDTLLQQRLAAEDVQYASRLAAACSRSQQLVSTHGGAATADADPIAGGSCTAVASSQVPSQQPSAIASSSHAHGTALPVEGATTAMSGVPVHQATPVAGAAAAMQPLRSQADLPDDSDFAERLRERDEAYAAALMARLVQKE